MKGGIGMLGKIGAGFCGALVYAPLIAPACCGALPEAPTLTPSAMPRIGTVDPRFQSYNIEMVEITGGRFWKPYRQDPPTPSDTTTGTDTNLYQYRPPIDLANARLRKLAAALGPVYVRISGTWANSTYFADSDDA